MEWKSLRIHLFNIMPNKQTVTTLTSTYIRNIVYFFHTGQQRVLKAITVIQVEQNGYYCSFLHNHDFPFNNASFTHLGVHWKNWCWSWNSNTLATWYKQLTHWKRPWCWERLKAGGEGDDRGWDGWMASSTWWTWVWVNSGSWWWTGRPGVLQFMGLQRVGRDWTELTHFYF